MNRTLTITAVVLVAICIGGCPSNDLDLEGSRTAVAFEIYIPIRSVTGEEFEAQSVTVTSWRTNAATGEVEADTTIETRYTVAAGEYAEVKADREYNVGDHERIVFHVISTGATTQGTATRTYQKGQASISIFTGLNSIVDRIAITVSDITTETGG